MDIGKAVQSSTEIDKRKPNIDGFSAEKSYHFDENASVESDCSSEETSDFRRALPQVLAVTVKNLVLFGYGLTLGFPTIVIPALKANGTNSDSEFSLSNEEISWFSSINLLCVPLGCFFSGVFTEPFGKRSAMQIIKVPIFVSWLLFYFSTNIYHLYAGLCLVGISGGLMETSVLTYVAEVTEPKYRGMLTATGTTCVVIGILVQFILGTFFQWRTIALICSVLPLLTITALFFVPESPYWLLTKNRATEARKSLAWLRGWVEPHQVDDEFCEIHQALLEKRRNIEETSSPEQCLQRFVPYTKKSFLVPFSIVTGTLFVGCFSGKTPLQTYAVEIFQILDTPMDKYHATVLLGISELIGAIFCVLLVRFTGKRPLVFLSLIVSALCFSSTGFYAKYYGISPNNSNNNSTNTGINISNVSMNDNRSLIENMTFLHNTTDMQSFGDDEHVVKEFQNITQKSTELGQEKSRSWIPLALLLCCALFTHIGIGLIPWALIGEMYGSNVRSGASGLSSGSGYLFAFFSNKLFLWMIDTFTLSGTFWFYSSVSIIGCITFYFYLPETEGRTLLDIEAHFAGKRHNSSDEK